ncbi:MAG: hypothetical protein KJ645_06945 [Planctomycetes bacterium]|nr:hypothetical protein [Planctomycetota bacterium]
MNIIAKHILIYSVMLTLFGFIAATGDAADYSNGVLSDQGNGFRINVPADWNRRAMSNQDSNTHLFVSPDKNVAVGVTTYPGAGRTALGQILSKFQGAVFAGSTMLVEQPASVNGINGTLRAYRVPDPNGPVIVGAFAAAGRENAYVVWSMIPEALYKSRFNESDAVTNTFAMTAEKQEIPKQSPQLPVSATPGNQRQNAPPAQQATTTTPSPPAASAVASRPLIISTPAAVSYRQVTNVPAYTFEVPSSYKESVKGNQLILQSTDANRSGLALVLQQMVRTSGGKHENLEKSVETALSQLRSAPSANLLERKDITVDGQPAVWLELTYEAGGGTQRMAQVLTADSTMVYWLGLSGPLKTFHAQVEDLNHAVNTVRMTNKPVASSSRPAAAARPGAPSSAPVEEGRYQYQVIVIDDSRFEFSYPKHFTVFQKSEGQSQWGDPKKEFGNRVVMVIETLGRNFGNTAESVYDGLLSQVKSASAADMVSSERTTVNGIPAYKVHFTLRQGTKISHFKKLILDTPGPNVVAVSFVGAEPELAEMDAHYAELLRSAKSTGAGGDAAAAPPSPSRFAAAGFSEPKSPEDAFDAIQRAVRGGDWESFVRLLHTATVEVEMSRFFGELAKENHVDIAGLSPREAMLKVLRQVPQAAESKLFMGKPAKITGTRKEDDDRVLVMTKFDNGGEQYLWMFREGGNWRWWYN